MKIALIGAGGIGHVHSDGYLHIPGAEVTAVADIRFEKAQEVAGLHSARAYPSVELLLENEKPDMVDICTPTYTHADIAIRCMVQGLHTLCEKPMALNLADAEAMAACAHQNGVMLMIAQVIRFWPEYAYLKTVYDQGTYGRLLQVSFSRTGGAPLWSWENWFTDKARSGLAPFDLHIHDADYIHYLLGKPVKVQSMALDRPELFSSYIRTRYFYENDVLVDAEGGWYAGQIPFTATYRAVFERAVLEYRNDALLVYPAGETKPQKVDFTAGVEMGPSINLTSTGPYHTECAYFVKCVQDNTPPTVITPEQSVATLKTLLAEIESAKAGQTLIV
jgi:predicted dehydrogenase